MNKKVLKVFSFIERCD